MRRSGGQRQDDYPHRADSRGSSTDVDPATIAAIAFNRRAAEELAERLDAALDPLGWPAGCVRVRTFRTLSLEILREAGQPIAPVLDRETVVRTAVPSPRRPSGAASTR